MNFKILSLLEPDMESIDQLAKKATCLRPQDRILLIEAILASLDKTNREIEKRWIDESEARYDAYKRGDLESVEWREDRKGYKP